MRNLSSRAANLMGKRDLRNFFRLHSLLFSSNFHQSRICFIPPFASHCIDAVSMDSIHYPAPRVHPLTQRAPQLMSASTTLGSELALEQQPVSSRSILMNLQYGKQILPEIQRYRCRVGSFILYNLCFAHRSLRIRFVVSMSAIE